METDQVILGLLMSGPKSGYRIKNITGRLMMAYNLSLNQIYPALRKLEAANLVKKDVVIQTGKPNMHVYALTASGRESFHASMKAPPVPLDYQLDFLTRAFFFRFLPAEEVIARFEQEICSLDEQLQDLELIRSEVIERGEEDGLFIFSTIVDMIQMLKNRYNDELARRTGGIAKA